MRVLRALFDFRDFGRAFLAAFRQSGAEDPQKAAPHPRDQTGLGAGSKSRDTTEHSRNRGRKA